eukprot:gene29689-33055_t
MSHENDEHVKAYLYKNQVTAKIMLKDVVFKFINKSEDDPGYGWKDTDKNHKPSGRDFAKLNELITRLEKEGLSSTFTWVLPARPKREPPDLQLTYGACSGHPPLISYCSCPVPAHN